jgi:hypothetical protein
MIPSMNPPCPRPIVVTDITGTNVAVFPSDLSIAFLGNTEEILGISLGAIKAFRCEFDKRSTKPCTVENIRDAFSENNGNGSRSVIDHVGNLTQEMKRKKMGVYHV